MENTIALWSGPRNLSTALMYFFAHRGDVTVLDEPFFGVFLNETGVWRPSREEALAQMPLESEAVLRQIDQSQKPLFLKNMANHWPFVPAERRRAWQAVFLYRHPASVIHSYHRKMEEITLLDLAYREQLAAIEELEGVGLPYFLLDSDELATHPERELKALCEYVHLPFDPQMLHWSAGPIPADGVWAKYWYHTVHHTDGFKARAAQHPPVLKADHQLFDTAYPLYLELKKRYHEQVQSSRPAQ